MLVDYVQEKLLKTQKTHAQSEMIQSEALPLFTIILYRTEKQSGPIFFIKKITNTLLHTEKLQFHHPLDLVNHSL